MSDKIIQVVDTSIFEEKLKMAEAVMPYVLSSLTTQKEVAKFLGKSSQTIATMVKDGVLTQGIHYIMEDTKRVWLPEGIIEFKLNPPKKQVVKKKYQPSAEAVSILN